MPQVPYKGYPDLGPERVPAHVEIPGAIFEGTRALEGFGRQLQGAGDELFARAMAMKAEQNTVEADEANVRYMTGAGELHADYNAKQGEDRVKAYPDYKNNLVNLRNTIASEMSNDQSKKLFLGKSVGTLSHSIFNGAGAAATAQKDWTKNTADATVGAATIEYSNNPNPQTLAKLQHAARVSTDAARGGGLNSTMANIAAETAVSNAITQRIQTLARNNYVAAEEMLNQNWNLLTPDDKVRANTIVTNQSTQLSGDQIGNDVLLWGQGTETKPQKSLAEMRTEVIKRVEQRDPQGNLPLLRKKALDSLEHGYNQNNHAVKVDEQQRIQDITGIIMKNNPRTLSELLKDPVANEIYYSMKDETNKLKVQGTINDWLRRSTYVENSDNFKKLRSMASDNVEAFMSTSPSDWKVSNGDWKSLYALREKILKGGATNDPRVDKAMGYLYNKYGVTLMNMGINKSRYPELYHTFRGGLAIAIDQFQETHKKPPTEKDVVGEIWNQMRTQGQRPRTWLFFGGDIPGTSVREEFWQMKVPQDARLRGELKQEIMKKAPPDRAEPDEGELQMEYHRQLWRTFTKGK